MSAKLTGSWASSLRHGIWMISFMVLVTVAGSLLPGIRATAPSLRVLDRTLSVV
jgi:hypothetical protein